MHTLQGVIRLRCTVLRVEWTEDNLSDRNVSPSQIANKTTGAIFKIYLFPPNEKTGHNIISRGDAA